MTRFITLVKVDLRGPDSINKLQETENMVNERLTELQSNGASIVDIKDKSKEGGYSVFLILYEMPSGKAIEA